MDLFVCVLLLLLHRNLIHESMHTGICVVSVILIRQKPSGTLFHKFSKDFSGFLQKKLFWLTCADKSVNKSGGSVLQELKIGLVFPDFPILFHLNRTHTPKFWKMCKNLLHRQGRKKPRIFPGGVGFKIRDLSGREIVFLQKICCIHKWRPLYPTFFCGEGVTR